MLYPDRRRPCRYARTEHWVGDPDAGGRLSVADYNVFLGEECNRRRRIADRTSSWASSVKAAWPRRCRRRRPTHP